MHGNAGGRGGLEDGSGDGLAADALKATALNGADLFGHDLFASRQSLYGNCLCIGQISARLDHQIGYSEPKDGSDNDKHGGYLRKTSRLHHLHHQA
jgi:hypothetical protein